MLSGSPCGTGIFIRLIFTSSLACHKTIDDVGSPGTSLTWEKSPHCPLVVDQTPGYQEGLEQT